MRDPATNVGNVLHRGFIPPEEVAAVERQPIAMVRSHVSWGSIIAGSIFCLGLLALSASFAVACGVPAFTGTGTYGAGAFIWSVITAIIAFGAAGVLSGIMAAPLDGRYSAMHGLLTWALTTVLVMVFGGAGAFLLGRAPVLGGDIREMTLVAQRVAPAWGAFISLACGLIAALIGGGAVGTSGRYLEGGYVAKPTT